MRFNFDFASTSPPPPTTKTETTTTTTTEKKEEEEEEEEHRALTTPSTTTTPSSSKEEVVEWVLLHNHPLFTPSISSSSSSSNSIVVSQPSSASRTLRNLFAWDGASRLYFWDSDKQCLHRISIRLGDPDPTSVAATSSSKMLQPDVQMQFVVNNICINGNGSAILLSGSDGLCVMYLYGRTSTRDTTIICRTVSVGAEIYFDNHNSIRTLQALWHPHSDTHLGILSSDSVFRLFDLSSDVEKPEQEYYLQPVEPGRSRYAAAICPVGFSFGGGHLWDRFTVFVLFSDGSIYILCPVVPFGSVYRWDSIWEIYNDAHIFGLRSSNPRAVSNSSLAIAWLEATFPELVNQAAEGGNLSALKAHPYVPFDASLSLQGPLRKVGHAEEDDSEIQGPKCEGRAVGFLYNIISKDSVLVTAWSSGQLQIDALADEIQPLWTVGNRPSLHVDSHDRILGLAMICESNMEGLSVVTLDQPLEHTVWLGNPPPLLSLAVVDLALPKNMDNGSLISMFPDPLVSERIYCLHSDGIDSIVLHFLPFTSQTSGKDETMKAPSVHPVLSTCQGETSSPSPLCGFVALADSFGYSWIVAVTSNYECIVLEMKGWNIMLPMHVDQEKKTMDSEEQEIATPDIISKELLSGPKVVLIPHASPSLRSVAADSIEGRSTLHQYFKLFHENYVEYAHKVWFELKHHSSYLKRIIDEDNARLHEVKQKLSKVEEKQPSFEDRISRAVRRHELLEERLHTLRNLPGTHKRPLSKAERDFKAELDRSTGRELDALRSSIEALNSRMRKFTQSSQGSGTKSPRPIQGRRRNHVPESQISNLRSAISKLSLVNSENTKKVKSVESTLKILENSKGKTLV